MVFKSFKFQAIYRVILISATLGILSYILFETEYFLTAIFLVLLTALELIDLINYVSQTRKELSNFINSIEHGDYFDSYQNISSGFNDDLNRTFKSIAQKFQIERLQKQEHLKSIQTIIQHVKIGLIAFDQTGEIELLNTAAKRILNILKLDNINDLNDHQSNFTQSILELNSDESKIIELTDDKIKQQLYMHCTEFKRQQKKIKLISIQDIRNELEEKEMDAWQKIMRVLTHEIRNSITPIASLSATANDLLESVSSNPAPAIKNEDMEDVRLAVDTIHSRSKGLLKFIESFRTVHQIPKPSFQIVSVTNLFRHLDIFFGDRFKESNIETDFSVEPKSLEITADSQMIEQVLINLILNSIAAVEGVEKPQIILSAGIDNIGKPLIEVMDNGSGILEETLERIFVPFFTTKSDGSGIGLALSRQIMRLHSGRIQVHSTPNKLTVFSLRF